MILDDSLECYKRSKMYRDKLTTGSNMKTTHYLLSKLEERLNPKYLNDVFTYGEIKEAIIKILEPLDKNESITLQEFDRLYPTLVPKTEKGAMQAYADQQVNKTVDDVITLITCNDFSLISQMVQAIEKLKIKQP